MSHVYIAEPVFNAEEDNGPTNYKISVNSESLDIN